METIDEKVSRCKNLLEQLNYFNGNVFLTGELKGLQILSLDNEGNVTVNIDEEKLHDFWQSYKTYYSMTADGKALYRVMLSMFENSEVEDLEDEDPEDEDSHITFADPVVKQICVENWGSDGEITYEQAAAVTDLGAVFTNNTEITSFDELQYFTGLTTLKNNAFTRCANLTSVTLPSSITTLENGIMAQSLEESYGCFLSSGLSSITIPASVTSIGDIAFTFCPNITSLTIPDSVTSIGDRAFAGCIGLTSITIPNSITSIGDGVFGGCSGLTSITIPNSVTSIGQQAFYGCSGLTSITIPNSVTSIGSGAFYGCSGLTSITVEATTPPTLGEDTFLASNITNFYVPAGSVDAYKAAPIWSDLADKIMSNIK